MKIPLTEASAGSPPPGLAATPPGLAAPPGLPKAKAAALNTPPGVLKPANATATLQQTRERLLVQNAMLSQAHAQAIYNTVHAQAMQQMVMRNTMAMHAAYAYPFPASQVTTLTDCSTPRHCADRARLSTGSTGTGGASTAACETPRSSRGDVTALPLGAPATPSTAPTEAEEPHTDPLLLCPKTTLIIKKVPKTFTRAMLLELLERGGLQGTYDFVYVPIDFDKFLGTGCAFVNFLETEHAERFMETYQGYTNWGVKSGNSKAAEIAWSQACQGKLAHVERYRDSPVMHPSVPDEFKPAVFENGQRGVFPDPVKVPKAPRLRRNQPAAN